MQTEELLIKILNATKPEDIFTKALYRKEYLQFQKLLHPDICQLLGAEDAAKKLNLFRTEMEGYSKIEEDAGVMQVVNDTTLAFRGDKALLMQSLENYKKLMSLTDEASLHFRKYLPASMELKDDVLYVKSTERMIPLTHLTLPQEHVTWLTSRMFELAAWLHQSGYCHAGINPESICIVPETHGIVCTSFYHLKPLNNFLTTISGRHIEWYPDIVFKEKKAIPYIDISLVQRTALYVLGDKSGNGIKLKKDHNENLIDFLITPHYDTYRTFDTYRKLLKTLFGKPKFYKLEI